MRKELFYFTRWLGFSSLFYLLILFYFTKWAWAQFCFSQQKLGPGFFINTRSHVSYRGTKHSLPVMKTSH